MVLYKYVLKYNQQDLLTGCVWIVNKRVVIKDNSNQGILFPKIESVAGRGVKKSRACFLKYEFIIRHPRKDVK